MFDMVNTTIFVLLFVIKHDSKSVDIAVSSLTLS